MAEKIEDLPIGTKLEINVTDPVEGRLNIDFISELENYKDENTMIIAAPIFEAKVYPVRVDSKIEAYAYQKNHVIKIAGVVVDRHSTEGIALLEVKIVQKKERIQRRQFFRFECSVPIVFYIKKQEETEIVENEITGRTMDLSGGGLLALTEEPLERGEELKGKVYLDEEKNVDFIGKVIRCETKKINEEQRYISSVSFLDLGFKEREMIVGYIFSQQRILLKKGLR